MKHKILLAFLFICTIRLSAQITRGQVIVGVDGLLGIKKTGTLQIPVNVGVFVTHNVAIGITGNYSATRGRYSGDAAPNAKGFGGFLRIYALPERSSINILLHAAYQHDFWNNIGNKYSNGGLYSLESENLMVALGPVFMISREASFEVMVAYNLVSMDTENKLIAGIGFQLHLGKARSSKVTE